MVKNKKLISRNKKGIIGNKKGISGVVVTVLLILVAITAVIVVWQVIKVILEARQLDVSVVTADAIIADVWITKNNLAMVKVTREPGAGDVSGLKFVFSNLTDEYVYTADYVLKELETHTFEIQLDGDKITNPINIQIHLLFEQGQISPVKSTAEKQGDEWVIYSGGGGGGGGSIVPTHVCGDGSVNQASEECDLDDLAGENCESLFTQGYSGSLICNTDCTFNTNACSYNSAEDQTPPNSVSGLYAKVRLKNSLTWEWVNPDNIDFNGVLLYLDGVNIINFVELNKNTHEYTASSLTPNTKHNLTIYTVDLANNINLNANWNTAENITYTLEETAVCTDDDNDGYAMEGGECGAVDCDDNNPLVHNLISCSYDGSSCGNFNLCLLSCPLPPAEVCDDSLDNDCDNSMDCADSECTSDVSCQVAPGLVAHYKFENNALDETGNNPGIWRGTETYATGKIGQAASFSNSYIEVADSPSLRLGDRYTISTWVKPNQLPLWMPILEKGPGIFRYMFWLSNDEIGAIGHKESPNTASTNADIPTDGWSHLICSFDYNANPQTRCWKNGIELALTSNTGIGHTPVSDSVLKIGSETSQNAYYFSGLIDEVKIWNRALSDAEIEAEYNLNVVDYYLCSELASYDNTQNDASSVIQACIDKVKINGVLELPAGKYYIDKQIKIRNPITLRTEGKTEVIDRCELDDATCAEIIAGLGLTELWGLLTIDSDNVNIDHIIINGNKQNRWNSVAGDIVRGGNSGIGHNLMVFDCSNCKFTNNVLKNGLSATAFGYGYGLEPSDNHNTLILKNTIAYNGMHNSGIEWNFLWSDGLTIHDGYDLTITNNEFIDNTDVEFIIGGCINCIIQDNTITHTGTISGGSFAALNLMAWHEITTKVQISTGNFSGSDISGNTIDCSVNKRCGFGIYLGSDAWGFPELSIRGGSVHDNIIRNAQQGFNVDRFENIVIYDNIVTASGGTFGTNKNSVFNYRIMGSYNIDPDSIVDRSLDSVPDSSYTHEQWGDPATGYWEIPNWFTDETCNMNGVCETGETAVYCLSDCGPVAYYKFDTNALDETVNNNDGTNNGAIFVPGRVGSAASFDGASYVEVADSPSLNFVNQVTISAWVKLSSLQPAGVTGIVERMQAASPYLGVELGIWGDGTNNYASFHAGGTYAPLPPPDDANTGLLVASANNIILNDGNWHYIIGVYDGVNSKIYIDGALDISQPRINNIQVSNEKINIGANYNGNNKFSGLIDEVKIWNRALSASEVTEEYMGNCQLTSASWSASSAIEGSQVSLNVYGTGCDGLALVFEVKEDDLTLGEDASDDDALVNPANAMFVNGVATTTWTAEWQEDCLGLCNPPEYYFIARLVGDTRVSIVSAFPELVVSQAGGYGSGSYGEGSYG